MANPYKDAAGHWTTKENDGGPCQHTDGKHQTKIENGSYYLRTSEDAPWEEVSYEEFNEVRQGGYSPFDEADDKLDFGFDEDEAADKQDNYATIAAEMTRDGVDINDKDAVLEQLYKKYNFSDDEIRDYMKNVYGDSMEEPKPQASEADIEKRKRELSNEYWGLAEDYQMEQRMNDDEWNARGFPDFEKKYGTEEEFIEKGLNKDKIDLNDRKTREDLTRVSENLDENKLKRMNQERNDRIENARDKWNDFVEQKNDTDRYSQPAYGDEEGHDYELDALRERDEKGLNNDFGPEFDDKEDGADKEGRRHFEERYGGSPDDHDKETESNISVEDIKSELNKMREKGSRITDEELNVLSNKLLEIIKNEEAESGQHYDNIRDVELGNLIELSDDDTVSKLSEKLQDIEPAQTVSAQVASDEEIPEFVSPKARKYYQRLLDAEDRGELYDASEAVSRAASRGIISREEQDWLDDKKHELEKTKHNPATMNRQDAIKYIKRQIQQYLSEYKRDTPADYLYSRLWSYTDEAKPLVREVAEKMMKGK